MPEELLNVSEAAEMLAVSPRTVQRYCKQGRLNYKWVIGKRHKELRIVTPITITDLPGIKGRHTPSTEDFVTKAQCVKSMDILTHQLEEKVNRIESLEREVAQLKIFIVVNFGTTKVNMNKPSPMAELKELIEPLVQDFQKVRPLEKKLILELAKEIKSHSEFLHSLDMKKDSKK